MFSCGSVFERRLAIAKTSLKKLEHRGPDETSSYYRPSQMSSSDMPPHFDQCFLGHTRLSIIDMKSSGRQPFVHSRKYRRGSVALIQNGEIYIHEAIRVELEREYNFSSSCDSEVLLASYMCRGLEWTLQPLIGMFAFVPVDWSLDYQIDRVIAARDPLGIKPLCIGRINSENTQLHNRTIVLASEMQAIPLEVVDELDEL